MTSRITPEEAELWQSIADDFRTATDAMESARLTLLLQIKNTDAKPLGRIETAIVALCGNAYMFTPQPEWIGGDSLDEKNHVINLPHIAY